MALTRIPTGRLAIILILMALTVAAAVHFGFECNKSYLVPVIFLAYFFAIYFDVPLPGLGHVNSDHIVAFPAACLLGNPFLVGLLNGAGYLAERAYRKEIKRLDDRHVLSFFSTTLSTAGGAWLFLETEAFAAGTGVVESFLLLMASLVLMAVSGFAILLVDRVMTRNPFVLGKWVEYLLKYIMFLFVTGPFLAIFLLALSEGHLPFLILSVFPLVSSIWSLRVNFKLIEKNDSLVLSTKKQEFLQQLLLQETGSLENQDFLKYLLDGLKEFIKWDRDLLFIASLDFEKQPVIFSTGKLPEDAHRTISSLDRILMGDDPLKGPMVFHGDKVEPLLDGAARSQLILPLATEQISFGVLVLERTGPVPFDGSEVQFGHSALAQVARYVQDRILKGQLLTTNQTLLRQTHYLSEILKISNLLKIHLSAHEILEEVARGISHSLGFQRVLISLYRKEDHCFERLAQAGLDDIWEKISAQRPPDSNILRHFKDEYKIGSCYFVRNVQPTAFTIMPEGGRPGGQEDDWSADDALFVPLLTSTNELLGVISVDEPRDGKIPSLETLNALEILANQAVHALESAEIHSEVKHFAVVDGLTNLYNHRYFQESLSKLLRQSLLSGATFSILMMDLDNFKEINDNFGHLAGDAVLKSVGQTLLDVTRKNDVAARYGGEEFAVLLNGLDKVQAAGVAERIRSLVEKKPITDESVNAPLKVTISIGIASFPEHAKENRELLKIADLALYRAKQAGKNRIAEGP